MHATERPRFADGGLANVPAPEDTGHPHWELYWGHIFSPEDPRLVPRSRKPRAGVIGTATLLIIGGLVFVALLMFAPV